MKLKYFPKNGNMSSRPFSVQQFSCVTYVKYPIAYTSIISIVLVSFNITLTSDDHSIAYTSIV